MYTKTLLCLNLIILTFFAHSQSWEQTVSLPNEALGRNHALTFSLNGFGYLGTGYHQGQNALILSDFYKFDPNTKSWTALGDFPAGARGFSYAVTAGGKAYVGFGIGVEFDSARNQEVTQNQSDLWEYDPVTEAWTELSSCPCLARYHPAFVSTEDKIFVGLGSSEQGNLRDWWEYDIATDTWSQKPNFPGLRRHHPYYFSIDSLAYVGFGHGRAIYKDFYSYNPRTEEWTEIAEFPGESRVAGTQFSHRGKGYILSGQGSDHENLETGEFWEFDPFTEEWTQLAPHAGTGRWAPASFIINDTLYFGTGYTEEEEKDMWIYPLPGGPVLSVDNRSIPSNQALVYPNPSRGALRFSHEVVSVQIFTMAGLQVSEISNHGQKVQLDLSNGTYLAVLKLENGSLLNQRLILTQ
jgi:N-acetylneuraminic acid mutarotase